MMAPTAQRGVPSPCLPWELIGLVFERSTSRALKSATLASHAMKHEADRCLWNKAVLSIPFFSSSDLLLRPLPILPPERIMHIKSIKITFNAGLDGGLFAAFLFRQIITLVIAPAIHVTSLTVHFLLSRERHPTSPDLAEFIPAITDDLFAIPCPSLTSFTVRGSAALGPSPLESRHIHSLSTTHPLLEALDLDLGLKEPLEAESIPSPLFPYVRSFHAHAPTQLLLINRSPLESVTVRFQLPFMEISDIFTKVEAFSKSLKTLKMKWITLDSTSGFTAVIRAALSGKFQNLETLSVNCLFMNRVYKNPLMINRARERTLKLYLSRLAKDGRTPNLRVIKLDNVMVEDINRLGNYVFQSAPPSLRTIEVNLAGNSYSSLYDDDPPPTYHTIEKIISDTGFPTLLHTVRQVNYKMEAVTNLATKQSIHRYSQISAVASVA